jgi:hypothetical protein
MVGSARAASRHAIQMVGKSAGNELANKFCSAYFLKYSIENDLIKNRVKTNERNKSSWRIRHL